MEQLAVRAVNLCMKQREYVGMHVAYRATTVKTLLRSVKFTAVVL